MYCIGLTGRMASGKTTASHLFRQLGIPVIHADQINRELLQPDSQAYQLIVEHFSKQVLTTQGQLDTEFLKSKIATDPSEKKWLESLLHPLIQKRIMTKINELQQAPYCIIEIPILIVRNKHPYLDRILLLDVDEATQLKRLQSRHPEQCPIELQTFRQIQASRQSYQQSADDFIANDGTPEELLKKIKNLHDQYLQFSRQKS